MTRADIFLSYLLLHYTDSVTVTPDVSYSIMMPRRVRSLHSPACMAEIQAVYKIDSSIGWIDSAGTHDPITNDSTTRMIEMAQTRAQWSPLASCGIGAAFAAPLESVCRNPILNSSPKKQCLQQDVGRSLPLKRCDRRRPRRRRVDTSSDGKVATAANTAEEVLDERDA
jgi:hypothetical protein